MAATAVQETKKPNMCLQSARVIRILKIIISYPVSVKINFLFQRNSFEWYLKKKNTTKKESGRAFFLSYSLTSSNFWFYSNRWIDIN